MSTVPSEREASNLFNAIGEPHRLRIVRLCFKGEQSVEQLLATLKIDKSLLSKHLKVLRENNILLVRRLGRQATYFLNTKLLASDKNTLKLPCCNIQLK
ncbi:MAG: hypothetical protein CL677_09825 [Bdellovibrionaceae bacterium]|nr:hypothetical protein [Pseudobdellovibrionaceae bacterium]|tara:strand:- start:412 stop:708 length:297 start_codon:yes stop_codon:yes gene_type:complete